MLFWVHRYLACVQMLSLIFVDWSSKLPSGMESSRDCAQRSQSRCALGMSVRYCEGHRKDVLETTMAALEEKLLLVNLESAATGRNARR